MDQVKEQENPVDAFFSHEVIQNPYPLYSELRDQGSVVYIESLDVWMVTRHKECKEILRSPEAFGQWDGSELNQANPEVEEEMAAMFGLDPSQAQGGLRGIAGSMGTDMMMDTLVTANPPEHTRYRHMTDQAWSAKRTAVDAAARITEIANLLVDDFAGQDRVEFMSGFAAPLPALVISEILGLPRDDWHDFKEWADTGLTLLSGNLTRDQVRPAVESMMRLTQYLGVEFAKRKIEPQNDALTALINARDKQDIALNDPELLSIGLHLLGAGHETTINAIGSTMWLLLGDDTIHGSLLKDPSLIPTAVSESLRLESPVQFLFRQCTQPTEIDGTLIPEGARVCVLFASANRDERVFENPDTFDLHRQNTRQHLSFGFGIHRCVGEPLSIRELETTVEVMLARFPEMSLAPNQSFEHNNHTFLRRLRALDIDLGSTMRKTA